MSDDKKNDGTMTDLLPKILWIAGGVIVVGAGLFAVLLAAAVLAMSP